jgi:hypothetical protein
MLPTRLRQMVPRGIVAILLLLMAYEALDLGLRLRAWLWIETTPIRFTGDINNGLRQGLRVLGIARRMRDPAIERAAPVSFGQWYAGFVETYPRVAAQHEKDKRYGLDYTPLRLGVMSLWARHVDATFKRVRNYRDEMAAPLLRFNTGFELTAAVLMFFLVRLWVRRGQVRAGVRHEMTGDRSGEHEGALPLAARRFPHVACHLPWICGLLAALSVWFNPVVLLNAHAWPQWDVWLVPFFIGAMLAASLERWMMAGALLAIGCMLKGQLGLVAPIFILWPIFEWKLLAAARAAAGFALAAAICVAPWMIRNPSAGLWVVNLIAMAGAICIWLRWFAARPQGVLFLLVIALALLICPMLLPGWWALAPGGAIALAMIASGRWSIGRGPLGTAVAFVAAGAIFSAGWLFGGTFSWYAVGFAYPTEHYLTLIMGPTSNLPAILKLNYHWELKDVVTTYHSPLSGAAEPITMQWLLRGIYVLCLVLCAIGAAIHSRQRSPRLLLSLVAPWIIFFAILPQMHERYLLWAAAVSAVCFAIGAGATMLHFLVVGLALVCEGTQLLRMNSSFMPRLLDTLNTMHPGIGWMVALCAAIWLYLAIAPAPRVHSR